MRQKGGTWQNRAFVLAFLVLTFFCWCPLGYGAYGEAPLFFGVPSWAVVAVALSVVLLVLEWVYLFHTPMAMRDEDVPDLIAQLKAVDTESPATAKEDE